MSHVPRLDTGCQLMELVGKSQKPFGLSSRRTPHSEKWPRAHLKLPKSALSLAQVLLLEGGFGQQLTSLQHCLKAESRGHIVEKEERQARDIVLWQDTQSD